MKVLSPKSMPADAPVCDFPQGLGSASVTMRMNQSPCERTTRTFLTLPFKSSDLNDIARTEGFIIFPDIVREIENQDRNEVRVDDVGSSEPEKPAGSPFAVGPAAETEARSAVGRTVVRVDARVVKVTE